MTLYLPQKRSEMKKSILMLSVVFNILNVSNVVVDTETGLMWQDNNENYKLKL